MTTQSPNSRLLLDHPAQRWLDAFPLGNGRLGAMVFGGTHKERIALNHENLWRGVLKQAAIPEAHEHLSQIREAFFAGNITRGTELANQYLGGPQDRSSLSNTVQPYQPFGDLRLDFDIEGAISEYKRELDFQTGIATTQFVAGSTRVVRQVFVSAVHQVIVVESVASHPCNGEIILDRVEDPDARISSWSSGTSVGLDASFSEGILFSAQAHIFSDGMITPKEPGKILFTNAKRVQIILALATNYHKQQPSDECKKILSSVPQDFSRIKSDHSAEHRILYDRVVFELAGSHEDLPVDKRIKRLQAGENDPGLFALYFNYARYLLIASSRNCDQPANLQGLWNQDLRPPWNSDFHADINLQMNYWHAELCALPECADVLYSFLERHVPLCREAAQRYFGGRGIFFQAGDIWKMNWMSAKGWDVWTGGAAWFAEHFWWKWLYTHDKIFLEKRAYPFIKEVAQFYEDFLVEDKHGNLITVPSQSPENRFVGGAEPVSLCIGATMDYILIREVLGNAIEASKILTCDEISRAHWEKILARLPDFKIGSHGQLQEWQEDYEEVEPGHRHISHLYGVHPANIMTPTRLSQFYNAARVSLERRLAAGGGHTGWSRAWTCCFWARFGEGERAYEHLSRLITDYNTESLLDTHPLPNGEVFQIDGNFGGATAVAELLLQFHDGYINILPFLPATWQTGCIHGLRTWGGFEISMNWINGILHEATICAHVLEEQRIKLPVGKWIGTCGENHFSLLGEIITDVHIPKNNTLTITAL